MDKQKHTGINSEGTPEESPPPADQDAFWEGRLFRLISDIHRNVSHIGFNDVVRVTFTPHGGLMVQSIVTNRAYSIPSYRGDRDVEGSNPRMCAESPKYDWNQGFDAIGVMAEAWRARNGAQGDPVPAAPMNGPPEESIMIGRWRVTGPGCEQVALKVAEHAELSSKVESLSRQIESQAISIASLIDRIGRMRRALDALIDE